MSFILDALKKSEQERRRREVPDLHTDHAPAPVRRSGIPPWALLVGLALLLNAGLLLWWLRPWQPPIVAVTEAPLVIAEEAAPQPPPAAALSSVAAETPVPETPPPPPATVVPEAVEPPPVREVAKAAPQATSPIPQLHELPRSLRAELPEIDISLHFFADEPAARMVRINGRNLREGQPVSPNLTVQKITPEGVVLDFRGQLFSAGR